MTFTKQYWTFILTGLALILLLILFKDVQKAQSEDKTEVTSDSVSVFDQALATELGADDYGMKTYVMAFLKAGPNRSQDSITRANLQRAHLNNIKRLANEGTLVLAGPFLDEGPVRGIYIFDVRTLEEAAALTKTDPAIQAGSLEMELHPWYGSAALSKLLDIHPVISKKQI